MKERKLVVRLGNNFFLHYIYDCYASLAPNANNSSEHGVAAFVAQGSSDNLQTFVHLSTKANEAFSKRLADDEDVSLFAVGHCARGAANLYSLDYHPGAIPLSAKGLAQQIDNILHGIGLDKDKKHNLVKLNIIACEAAAPSEKRQSFAVSLLEELHAQGYRNFMIKANTGLVSVPFFGHTIRTGTTNHFYLLGDDICEIAAEKDSYYKIIRVLKQCCQQTDDAAKQQYLQSQLVAVKKLGFHSQKDDWTKLQQIVKNTQESSITNKYRYRPLTSWFMWFFNPKTRTRRCLDALQHDICGSGVRNPR